MERCWILLCERFFLQTRRHALEYYSRLMKSFPSNLSPMTFVFSSKRKKLYGGIRLNDWIQSHLFQFLWGMTFPYQKNKYLKKPRYTDLCSDRLKEEFQLCVVTIYSALTIRYVPPLWRSSFSKQSLHSSNPIWSNNQSLRKSTEQKHHRRGWKSRHVVWWWFSCHVCFSGSSSFYSVNSLDCRESLMKKNSLYVCRCQSQRDNVLVLTLIMKNVFSTPHDEKCFFDPSWWKMFFWSLIMNRPFIKIFFDPFSKINAFLTSFNMWRKHSKKQIGISSISNQNWLKPMMTMSLIFIQLKIIPIATVITNNLNMFFCHQSFTMLFVTFHWTFQRLIGREGECRLSFLGQLVQN